MSTEISIKDAAKQLDISEQRVRTLCRQSEIESKKFGNSWVINAESINRYGLRTAHTIAEDHPAYNVNEKSKKPIALSFFSGAMGLDLGIEKSGFDVRLACEVDKYCRQTITLNKPDTALLTDINEYSANEVRLAAGLNKDEDIDLIIPHQPNMRILDKVIERLNIPLEKILLNVESLGNMASGSLPVTLAMAREEGRLKEGDLCLIVGYGSGATWGATLYQN